MIGGTHTVSATGSPLVSGTLTLNFLILRLKAGSAVLSLRLNGTKVGELKADEQLVFGPFAVGAGGVKPSELNVIGTANNELYWLGVEA